MLFSKRVLTMSTKVLAGAAISLGSAPAWANPCVMTQAGCVLPIQEGAAPPPPAASQTVYEPVPEARGIGIVPIVVGLGLAALVAILLLNNGGDDDDELPDSP